MLSMGDKKVTKENVDNMVKQVDKDLSGEIEFEEFLDLIEM